MNSNDFTFVLFFIQSVSLRFLACKLMNGRERAWFHESSQVSARISWLIWSEFLCWKSIFKSVLFLETWDSNSKENIFSFFSPKGSENDLESQVLPASTCTVETLLSKMKDFKETESHVPDNYLKIIRLFSFETFVCTIQRHATTHQAMYSMVWKLGVVAV